MKAFAQVLLATAVALFVFETANPAPLTWMPYDKFDEINDRFSSVTAQNCRSKAVDQLRLPKEAIAQIPRYNLLLSTVIYSNRSSLLHLHNMALNRAFFYSFIYQNLNNTWDFETQPGLEYMYMSASADVAASPGIINGSALFFDTNCSYPNYYKVMEFNTTLELFGPRAWRADDYNEPTNWLREPTNTTMDVWDIGAGRTRNYTSVAYKNNPWYNLWMPDLTGEEDSLRKFTYSVGIKRSNTTGQFVRDEFEDTSFFGPPQPGQRDNERYQPVIFTQPYFDCGFSNKWIVSATAPVVEYMPRYSIYYHLRRARFVAVSTMNIEFERIDMNQCPLAEGNPAPNYFAGTDRCRATTMCEPLSGYGFRRGGYQCVCQPGYYYPWWHDGPFLGIEIEQATRDEYETGFDCIPVQERQVIPNVMPEFVSRNKRSVLKQRDHFLDNVVPKAASPRLNSRQKRRLVSALRVRRDDTAALRHARAAPAPRKTHFVSRHLADTRKSRHKRSAIDEQSVSRMLKIMNRKYQTNRDNCRTKTPTELLLPGDVGYGVERQFENQGRAALRLAHFLSNFLQNVDEFEEFGNLKGDRRINETQIYGEVIANVMTDFKVLGCGVFYDRYMFRMSPPVNNTDPRYINGVTREFFGPYAWRRQVSEDGMDEFKAIDYAGFEDFYTDTAWFRNAKARWATNTNLLKKFTVKPMIRSDEKGTASIRFEYYPLTYRAAVYEEGEWLRPQFKCDGRVDDWVITYIVPFFGYNSLKTRIEFKGLVSTDVKLDHLDINQCPMEFHVANAFKNTARCHFQSQYCVPLEGKRFIRGGYKCECRMGYEYPFNDLAWFFDGQTMEEEYKKFVSGQANRMETLKCRIAGASSISSSSFLVAIFAAILLTWQRS